MQLGRRLAKRLQAGDGTPQERCEQLFRVERFPSAVLAELFVRLHDADQYDLAVEGLLAAIRHNQAQPWMYAILPLEMKLAERPQTEIDRALLSRVDFATGDAAQVLVTASLLTRLGSWDQAIGLCRETVRHDPWQTSMWLKSRSIADRSGDASHIVWSRLGILSYVWTDDADIHHAEARETLETQLRRVRQSGPPELASEIAESIRIAKPWDLIVTAEWRGRSDIDLVVTEPDGTVCNHSKQITPSGGILAVTGGGNGNAHLEQYRCQRGLPGTYRVKVKLIRGKVTSGRVRLKVERYAGSPEAESRTINLSVGQDDAEVAISLENGRGRKQP